MKRIVTIMFGLLTLFSLSACDNATPPVPSAVPSVSATSPAATVSPSEIASPPEETASPPTADAFRFTQGNMPRIDGSTATIPLIGAVYSVLLGLPRAEADAMVSVSGTDTAYNSLMNDAADILLVYSPSPDTLSQAEKQGVKFDMAPIGRDGLVFLVNKLNPVDSLTPEQLVRIYAGEVTNWKDVRGEDVTIKAFQRQHLSGSQTMMDALVMKDIPMAKAELDYVLAGMGELVEAIASYDNARSAIGYNVYYFVSQMALDPNVKLLKVGGVAPTTASISDGTYPFVSAFYAVIRSDEGADSPARILFDWIQSPDGQNLVTSEGYSTAVG